MVNVWGCGIDKNGGYCDYPQLKKRNLVAQGWSAIGDLSKISGKPTNEIIDSLKIISAGKSVPEYMLNSKNEPVDGRSPIYKAFKALLSNDGIKKGDLIIGYEGHEAKGICVIPSGASYKFDDGNGEYKYAHCFGPVKWIDWEVFTTESAPHPGYAPGIFPSSDPQRIIELWQRFMAMTDLNKILKTIPQIILHGPPGTGKTYRAKQMVKPSVGFAEQKINSHTVVRSDSNSLIQMENYKFYPKTEGGFRELYGIWHEFKADWSIERLKAMKLEDYTGLLKTRGTLPPAFHYVLERGDVKTLGQVFTGGQRNFAIYEYSTPPDHDKCNMDIKFAWLRTLGKDRNEAFQTVRNCIVKIATMAVNHSKLSEIVGDSDVIRVFGKKNHFVHKIISLYQDEDKPIMAHIFSPDALQYYLKNYCNLICEHDYVLLQQEVLKLKPHDMKIIEYTALIWENYPHREKKIESVSQEIEADDSDEIHEFEQESRPVHSEFVQFHPSYNYEDFVRGIKAETENNQIKYKEVDKIFSKMCKTAGDDPDSDYYLIIDEINRANVATVLGELLYALEYRDEPVTTTYASDDGDKSLTVPNNLYIIGTMNSSDRSIGHIDYAVRRRFAFIPCLPDRTVISDNNLGGVKDSSLEFFDLVAELFTTILSKDYHKEDVQIGHTYFLAKTAEELQVKMQYQVVPLLKEYLRDGILTDNGKVNDVIKKIAP